MKHLFDLAVKATTGEMSIEEAHAAIQLSNGKAGLFKQGQELSVLDVDGNPLITGQRYRCLRRGVVLIINASFGAGNIMDTYYRVHYYYGEEMKEGFTVVDGKGSPFSGFEYRSEFKIVK